MGLDLHRRLGHLLRSVDELIGRRLQHLADAVFVVARERPRVVGVAERGRSPCAGLPECPQGVVLHVDHLRGAAQADLCQAAEKLGRARSAFVLRSFPCRHFTRS